MNLHVHEHSLGDAAASFNAPVASAFLTSAASLSMVSGRQPTRE
jgi:hypothetical protein